MANYTILSIDDDMSARVLFDIMLKRSGFEVLQAEDADEALKVLEDTRPDLIMTDIQLPGMNGIELVHLLREREELDQTAIVVLSAFQGDKMQNDAIVAGADAFFQKPLKMNELTATLTNLIEARQSAD